jgi:dTDP-4-amino-4,6-dideoxygalactose transaminase
MHSEIKFIDPSAEYNYMKQYIDKVVLDVIDSGYYLLGEHLKTLENNVANFSNKRYAVGVKNATDAIILTLLKVYKKGMPVIIPNFGAYPTAVAALNVVDKEDVYYVDVDRTMTMDYKKTGDQKDGIVIFVSLFGNNGNISKIREYCNANNHILLLDAAQSFGSTAERYADYVVYSFYPTKPLSSFGDGGMVVSNNDITPIKCRRFYGIEEGKVKFDDGINSRLDEIQSSILNVKLGYFEELLGKRRAICNRYLKASYSINWNNNSVFHQFVVLYNKRHEIIQELKNRSIPYMIHYPYHVTDFNVLKCNNNDVKYRVNDKVISLPCHPFLTLDQISYIEKFLMDFKGYEVLE